MDLLLGLWAKEHVPQAPESLLAAFEVQDLHFLRFSFPQVSLSQHIYIHDLGRLDLHGTGDHRSF